jgi:hypothetical protein
MIANFLSNVLLLAPKLHNGENRCLNFCLTGIETAKNQRLATFGEKAISLLLRTTHRFQARNAHQMQN